MAETECPLCPIWDSKTEHIQRTRYIECEPAWENRGRLVFIVPTKNDKSHKFRFMVLTYDHVGKVEPEVLEQARAFLFEFMLKFGVDFAINEPTHATVPGHWHLVAQDLDPSGTDTAQVVDTARYQVHFKRQGDAI